MNNPIKIYQRYGGIRLRIFHRAIVLTNHGRHTTRPDFDPINYTPWRQFETYRRPSPQQQNDLIINKPWRKKTVPFPIDLFNWNKKHQQNKENNKLDKSMAPSKIQSPPAGRGAKQLTIGTRATTRVKSLAHSASELKRIEGKDHKAAELGRRREELVAKKTDAARKKAAVLEKRKAIADNVAARERAEMEDLAGKLEEAKKKSAEADLKCRSLKTDAKKESRTYLAMAQMAGRSHQGKKSKAADETANVVGQPTKRGGVTFITN